MAPPPLRSASSPAVANRYSLRAGCRLASPSARESDRPCRRRLLLLPGDPSSSSSCSSLLAPGDVRLDETVAGALLKWVNYGRGWHRRWFVLRDGVLSYYKIHGADRIETAPDAEMASRIIGEDSVRRISRRKSSVSQLPGKPIGEVHLKVSSIEESKSDEKRFSIFTGTKMLHLRADTREDRIAWMEALQAAKDMFPRISNSDIMSPVDNVLLSTFKVRQRLLEEGVSETAIQDCEQIIRNDFASMHNQLVLLKQKQIALLETLRQLEVEGTCSPDISPTESDYDNDRHDAPEEVIDKEDKSFFDTRDFLSSSSYRSSESEFPKSQIDSDDENSSVDGTDSSMRSVGEKYTYVRRRKKLPDPVEKEQGVSLWSLIKDNIGKDLTKVCLPVYFNEPLSSLQKCFEDFEYSYLLDQAYECGKKGDGLMRILNVAAFAVSGYASTDGRSCKPFNPLLGETYEAEYPEKGLRFVSEKVSHHPMVIACHCEGNGWRFWADSNLRSKFWGRSIQLDPIGILNLEFDDGEVYQWNKVTTSIYNLILGKLYCDHYGTMRIQGNGQYSCKLKFKEHSIMDRNPHQVQGVVQDGNGKTVATLIGKWDESMHYKASNSSGKGKSSEPPSSEGRPLWKRSKPARHPTRYNLTRFALTVNELNPGLKEKLPPTDSRLRPDQRSLENGEYEKANAEKLRLEQRQRQAGKMQETGWRPRWFARDKASGAYRYMGGYWEAREEGKWDGCPDIFGNKSIQFQPMLEY